MFTQRHHSGPFSHPFFVAKTTDKISALAEEIVAKAGTSSENAFYQIYGKESLQKKNEMEPPQNKNKLEPPRKEDEKLEVTHFCRCLRWIRWYCVGLVQLCRHSEMLIFSSVNAVTDRITSA